MKLLIDFQACQSKARTRGIGRYAYGLLKAMAEMGALDDVTLHINKTLTNETDPMLHDILDSSPNTKIIGADYLPMDVAERDKNRDINVLKFAHLAEEYDGILFIDPMEGGFSDFTPNSKKKFRENTWLCAVIHDFIPLILRDHYLSVPELSIAYHGKLQLLRSCDCLLANSLQTKKDAQKLLGLNPDNITNISGGIDAFFDKASSDLTTEIKILRITKDYILHVAADDYRKNTCGLIDAYSFLPNSLRSNMQLVIACGLSESNKSSFRRFGAERGLSENDLVFTGYISDDMLKTLYQNTKLFVFPSLYEGLGFPVLEAIKCGAPVLAGDNSSLPEVVGTEEALFDASSPSSISEKIQYALNNPEWLKNIWKRQQKHAESFTWKNSAKLAVAAIESNYAQFNQKKHISHANAKSCPRIAIFTPLPPQKSGISNYNARLIPHMLKHFDIDLIIDNGYTVEDYDMLANHKILTTPEFERVHIENQYDMLVFHIGNSHFHPYMLPMLMKYGGVSVMHDVFLEGLADLIEAKSHGTIERMFEFSTGGINNVNKLDKYTFLAEYYNKHRTRLLVSSIINCSYGVLLHSECAKIMLGELAPLQNMPLHVSIMGTICSEKMSESKRSAIKERRHIPTHKIICGAFGMVHPIKGIENIVDAILRLQRRDNIALILAGEAHRNHIEWIAELKTKARHSGLEIIYTGFLEDDDFFEYMSVCDFVFSLREKTRGETSAALMDILGRGIPAIVYDIGSFSEFSDNIVYKIPQNDKAALSNAIENLKDDYKLRQKLSDSALEYARSATWSRQTEDYYDIIHNAIGYKKRIKDCSNLKNFPNIGEVSLSY
ncbi:hypothetical protein FACS1894204_00670 [Synergistales bacterium]|nr:hypothetical protein FACS1894204_00670 [Synergistales bacterium]